MKRKLIITAAATGTAIIGLLCAFIPRQQHEYMLPKLAFAEITVTDRSIPDFWIGLYEITNLQYATFLSAVGRGSDPWFDKHGTEPGDWPARNLTKADATAFCRWLTQELRVRGKIAWNQEVNLPTDAQFSAVIGLKPSAEQGATPDERMKNSPQAAYYWGLEPVPPVDAGNLPRTADFSAGTAPKDAFAGESDGFVGVAPVGRFKSPGSPVFDIVGGVWEMLREPFNATGPVCLRGSSYKSAAGVQVSHRNSMGAKDAVEDAGFRVVLETLPEAD